MRTSDYLDHETYEDDLYELERDRIEDTRREQYDDEHADNMECPDCLYTWYSRIIPATRVDPAEAVQPDCPRCNA